MSKTNFTKVEEALAEEMRKMAIQKIVGSSSKAPPEDEHNASQKIIKQLIRDINPLIKKDKQIFSRLGFQKEQIKSILEEDPLNIKAEDWKILMQFKEKLDSYKAEKKKKAEGIEETLVEDERRKHINKRFNINDEWLPLQ